MGILIVFILESCFNIKEIIICIVGWVFLVVDFRIKFSWYGVLSSFRINICVRKGKEVKMG